MMTLQHPETWDWVMTGFIFVAGFFGTLSLMKKERGWHLAVVAAVVGAYILGQMSMGLAPSIGAAQRAKEAGILYRWAP